MSRAEARNATETLPEPSGDEPLYEVVDGRRVALPLKSVVASLTTNRLLSRFGPPAILEARGTLILHALFVLDRARNLQRRPKFAFVSAERWPLDTPIPDAPAWDVIPDLAVEVVSPTDSFHEVVGKVREYFDVGVRLVWVVIPSERLVYVYTSPTTVSILDTTAELDGGAVLPGLHVPLAGLFPPIAATSSEGD